MMLNSNSRFWTGRSERITCHPERSEGSQAGHRATRRSFGRSSRRHIAASLAVSIALLGQSSTSAQEANPFGDPPPADAPPADNPPADSPPANPPTATPAPPARAAAPAA